MKIAPLPTAIVLCVVSASISAAGDVKRDVAQAAHELLRVTGAGELGMRMMNQMIDVQRRTLPDVPDKFWQDFMVEVDPDDLNRLVVPVYARHFTVAEMESMIAFYRTPAGQKLVSKLPVLTEESTMVGRQWGMELGGRIARKLKENGLVQEE
ncbi:MAG: DUF2059 domain-containing protein [Acidiferrobacterales bacterium]